MTEPKVFLIAETSVLNENLKKMLETAGGSTAVSWYSRTSKQLSSEGEYLIEVAGRMCYKSFGLGLNPNITRIRKQSKDYIENVLDKGDGSILEHSTCTFAFLDVSRVFTHELVRHRAGVAISQESLRYVRLKDLGFWIPPGLENREEVKKKLEGIERDYRELEKEFDWDKMSFDAKKSVTSALRRIIPQGISTNIIWTANHRAIRHVITMRTNESAEVEIRQVFGKVAEIVRERYPLVYSDFARIPLSDGTASWRPTHVKV